MSTERRPAGEEPTDDGSAIGGSEETAAGVPPGHGRPGVGGAQTGGNAEELGGDVGGLKGQGGMTEEAGV